MKNPRKTCEATPEGLTCHVRIVNSVDCTTFPKTATPSVYQSLAQAGATVGIRKPATSVDPPRPRLLSLTADGIDSLFNMSVQVVKKQRRFVRNGSKGRFA